MCSKRNRQTPCGEEFRRKILTAARELFSQEGYANSSMCKLAAKSECSPTTIDLCLRNKDHLLFSICEKFYRFFRDKMAKSRASRTNLLDMLRRSLHSYIDIGLQNPEHYKTVFFTSSLVYGSSRESLSQDIRQRRAYPGVRRTG